MDGSNFTMLSQHLIVPPKPLFSHVDLSKPFMTGISIELSCPGACEERSNELRRTRNGGREERSVDAAYMSRDGAA